MVKSLHELREAGVNKRFLDNVEGYFEDIEGNVSIGQKRAGCIELVTKLRDKSFLHKFRANNFESRLLVDFRKQTDEIIRFVLSFMVWTFLEDDANAPVLQLVHENGIISMLDSMLDSTREILLIAKDKKTNMSKAAQSLVADFCNLIKKSKIFNKLPKVLSPQVMALATLDAVIRGLRQAGWMGDCLPIAMVRKLVKILEPFQGERDLEKRKRIDPLLVEIPVSILESHSIGSESARETELSNEELGTLANILPGVMDFEGDDFTSVQLLTLRLSINLTNHRPVVCDTFGRQDIISRLVGIAQAKFQALSGPLEENRRSVELDFLILSLALMINFAEMSDAARLAFIQGLLQIPQLDTLLLLFLERLGRAAEADSMEESQSNVGFGYLSILLGNLCQNTTVRNLVRSKMPEKTLAPLVNAVLEFVSHNRKVDEEADEESWHKGYTERLEQVAVRLQNIEGFS
ncbi:wings apart-like protein regulation of heterochromatin-domain-containing protein [Kalaharituber pfeilii]|nr:wings apart-like protein regulation of heterochromatin-domain-containing protein [Kalaharituber pfeilii]